MKLRSGFVAAIGVLIAAGCEKGGVKDPVSRDYKPPKVTTAEEDIPRRPDDIDRKALPHYPLVCEFHVEDGPVPVVTGAVSSLSKDPVKNVLLAFSVQDRSGRNLGTVRTRIAVVTETEPRLFSMPAPKGAYTARIATLQPDRP